MQNVNIFNVSKTLLETLNASLNASENARLPNTKNFLISVLTLVKTLNATQNAVAEHDLSVEYYTFSNHLSKINYNTLKIIAKKDNIITYMLLKCA